MSQGTFPKPYVNDVALNTSTMKYVNGGDFDRTEIGARPSGKPKDVRSTGMGIDHVGMSAGKK